MYKHLIQHSLWAGFCAIGLLLTACGSSKPAVRPIRPVAANPVLTTASTQTERHFDYYYLEALRLRLKGEHDAAFALFDHCLNINPNAPEVLYEVAQYHFYLKQNAEGLAALEKAVALAPDNYWYSQALATVYRQQNDTEKAIDLLQAMALRFPTKRDIQFNLLEMHARRNEYPQMITLLNQLESYTGRSEQLTLEKFRIYTQMNKPEKALHEMEALAKDYPADLRFQVLLGDVHLQQKHYEEAHRLYRGVLDAEPDNPQAMLSMASYYELTDQEALYRQLIDSLLLNKRIDGSTKASIMRQLIGESEENRMDSTAIIDRFDRILALESDEVQVPMLYAQYLLSKHMESASIPVLEKVIALDPTNTTARMMLIASAVRREDADQIIRICEPGIEASPATPELYYYLAVAYNQKELPDSVISVCTRALQQEATRGNKALTSDFFAMLGDCQHSKDKLPEAYAAYDSALVYNPENIAVLNNYAYYLSLEKRDLERAEEMSYRTVKAEPNNPTYADTYAWILFERGDYTRARIHIDNALKNGGDESDVVLEHCGDIYAMLGLTDEAVDYWKRAQSMGSTSKTLKKKIAQRKYLAP
ncbi:MAG: tetratricopeptide repeat protein [Bacteroides sp.]|nr:tetratricopeptide repeat protein [Bacteroides sp.]